MREQKQIDHLIMQTIDSITAGLLREQKLKHPEFKDHDYSITAGLLREQKKVTLTPSFVTLLQEDQSPPQCEQNSLKTHSLFFGSTLALQIYLPYITKS